jgi:hypothetical protein
MLTLESGIGGGEVLDDRAARVVHCQAVWPVSTHGNEMPSNELRPGAEDTIHHPVQRKESTSEIPAKNRWS